MANDPLSPFVGALEGDVRDALLALCGVEHAAVTGFALAGRGGPTPGWLASITLALDGASLVLDVADAKTPREAWFRTAHFAWAYRAAQHGDPFAIAPCARWLHALRARVEGADRALIATSAVRAVLDAVTAYQPFARLRDASFRLRMEGPSGPTGILWLGATCDQDCAFCWQDRRAPSPPPERFAQWLDELLASGVRAVILSGGEPTLREDTLDLARRARAAGAAVVLESNGLRLVDGVYRQALREAGVGELSVSFHAADATTSEALTRAPDTHARTVEGIEACLREGMAVGLHCVVERANVDGLGDYADFVVRRFAGVRRVGFSLPTRYADVERYRRGLAPLDRVRPALTRAIRVLRAAGIEANWEGMGGFPPCAVEGEAVTGAWGASGDRVYARACDGCPAKGACPGVPVEYLEACGEGALRPIARERMVR